MNRNDWHSSWHISDSYYIIKNFLPEIIMPDPDAFHIYGIKFWVSRACKACHLFILFEKYFIKKYSIYLRIIKFKSMKMETHVLEELVMSTEAS